MLIDEIGNQTEEATTEQEDIDFLEGFDSDEELDTIENNEESEESTEEQGEEDVDSEDDAEEESDEDLEEEEEQTNDSPLEELEIKVLGETIKIKDIPRDELKADLQMGKDYGRVKGQRDALQDDVNEWNEISEMFDMTASEVKETLKNQKFKQIAEAEGRNVDDVKREYESNRKSAKDKMYSNFIEKYPDVNVDDLPQSVEEDVKLGKDLLTSYENHLREQKSAEKDSTIETLKKEVDDLKKQLKIKGQNTKAKKKSVVSKSKSQDTVHDDFLEGFEM